MPNYPYLFETKVKLEPGDLEVSLPPEHAPKGKVVVARQQALDLVAYLKSLDRSYALEGLETSIPTAPQRTASAATQP